MKVTPAYTALVTFVSAAVTAAVCFYVPSDPAAAFKPAVCDCTPDHALLLERLDRAQSQRDELSQQIADLTARALPAEPEEAGSGDER